jgi:hypothetical protein
VSTGVVSNYVVLAPAEAEAGEVALVLTDARCLPCSEGAPVVDGAGRLIGLVLPELQQRNGQVRVVREAARRRVLCWRGLACGGVAWGGGVACSR